MNRARNAGLVAAGIVLVVLIGATLHPGATALAVREAVVRRGAFVTKLPETGVIQLPRVVTVAAGVGGNIGLIAVKAGDRVRRGDLLATIVNPQILLNVRDAEEAAASAEGRARSVAEQTAVLPQQNHSAVVQAQAAVEQAHTGLSQARKDLAAGSQSGLGYGEQSAEEQRLAADATLRKAETDLREARRTYDANQALYAQKALSRDARDQSQARYEEALIGWQQADRERRILGGRLAREGQVLKGRVRAAEDQLRQAQAALAAARADSTQTRAGDLAAAGADASRAEAELAYARAKYAQLEVRAAFGGVVESVATENNDPLRPLQPGDSINAGQPLFQLAGNDRFVVRTMVDEQDVADVRLGQRAIVSGEDFAGRTLGGRVIAISPVAQRSEDPSNTSRQVLTTIALDATLPFLRDGMSVDVDLITHDERDVLAVPADALRRDETGATYVFLVRGGRAQRADVKLGARSDTEAVVAAGLRDGDVVVAEKNSTIVANAAVKAAPSPSPPVGATPL